MLEHLLSLATPSSFVQSVSSTTGSKLTPQVEPEDHPLITW